MVLSRLKQSEGALQVFLISVLCEEFALTFHRMIQPLWLWNRLFAWQEAEVVCKPQLGLYIVTWWPAYFLNHSTIQAPRVVCRSKASSQDKQRSLKSPCRVNNLNALERKICLCQCTSGVCKCLLWCQRFSVVLRHLAPNTITLQMLNIFTKWAISCKVGWKLYLSPPVMICIEK